MLADDKCYKPGQSRQGQVVRGCQENEKVGCVMIR